MARRNVDKDQSIKCLVVDDDVNIGLVEDQFRRIWENVTSRFEYTHQGALDAISHCSYDVIFYDLGMDEVFVRGVGDYRNLRQIRDLCSRAVLIGTSFYPEGHSGLQIPDVIMNATILYSHRKGELKRLLCGYGIELKEKR
ncbi:hypothetical protein HYX12_00600 [Candidatus Woesearchaeota archaeon]|nr:hypothetical protein [Candidatus Woesearchaeota archaeon]